METEERPALDLGSIDFTPDWAKKGAGVSVGRVRPVREAPGGARPDDRHRQGGPRPFDRKPQGGSQAPAQRWPRQRREDRPRPLDAEVKVLPEQRALGTIIRKLQQDAHAYKLKDLAYFFLDNPSSVTLKVTPRGGEGSRQEEFHQCKACGFAALSEEEAAEHVLSAHLGDYYDAVEVACEPPKGNFPCVARCGLSGVLLGPPNLHDFAATVREMVRTRYPEMGEERYRSHIEMVRDPETIEEWRKGAVKKTVFVAKGAPEGAPQLTREQAEAEFRRTIMRTMVSAAKSISITADVALKSPCRPLVAAAREALEAERRSPYAMCFALRGAFHHRKLHFFRANDARGPEFVIGMELKEFDAEHAVPALAKVANFIAEHPCSPMVDIATCEEDTKSLSWLVSTGHVVAFTNGVYSAVEKFPKYGPQWQKRKPRQGAPKEPAATEAPEAAAPAPVAEAQAAAEAPVAEAQAPAAAEPVPEAEAPAVQPPAETAEPEAQAAQETTVLNKEEGKDEASSQLA